MVLNLFLFRTYRLVFKQTGQVINISVKIRLKPRQVYLCNHKISSFCVKDD